MHTRTVRVTLAPLLAAVCATAAADPPAVPPQRVGQARAVLDAFVKEDYAAAGKDFDETMRKAFPEEKRRELWAKLIKQVGPFKGHAGARTERKAPYDVVNLTCRFEKADIVFHVAFDADGKVSGFRLSAAHPAYDFKPPPYARPDSYREEEVTVGAGRWALPGTLTIPKGDGPFPAVVLVHGSGSNDRDQTIGPNKVLRDLAWGLASQGIAVLRYEKRTRHYADRLRPEEVTVKEEVLDDALAAVAVLRGRKEVDAQRIFVAGHSLGGYLAPKLGTLDPQLAGLIVLAGPTRPLEDLIVEQVDYLSRLEGEPDATDKKDLEKLREKAARVKSPDLKPDTPSDQLPLGWPAVYWLSLRGYDPAATAAGLKMPLLVLRGERDYQVTATDFDGWKKALGGRRDVRLKTYPGLNHLFIEGSGKPSPADYEKAGHVSKEVVDDIAAWVKGR